MKELYLWISFYLNQTIPGYSIGYQLKYQIPTYLGMKYKLAPEVS